MLWVHTVCYVTCIHMRQSNPGFGLQELKASFWADLLSERLYAKYIPETPWPETPWPATAGDKIWKCLLAHFQAIATNRTMPLLQGKGLGNSLTNDVLLWNHPFITQVQTPRGASHGAAGLNVLVGIRVPCYKSTLCLPSPHQHAAKQKEASWVFVMVMLLRWPGDVEEKEA